MIGFAGDALIEYPPSSGARKSTLILSPVSNGHPCKNARTLSMIVCSAMILPFALSADRCRDAIDIFAAALRHHALVPLCAALTAASV